MNKYNTTCIILKSLQYRDADKIYTLYSKDKGKITAIAHGVRKITSKRAGILDTLNYVNLSITENNNFHTINEAKLLNSFADLKKSLTGATYGFYINKLLLHSIEDDQESQVIFEALIDTLKVLNSLYKINKDIQQYVIALICRLELIILNQTGYQVTLNRCVFCNKKIEFIENSHQQQVCDNISNFRETSSVNPSFDTVETVLNHNNSWNEYRFHYEKKGFVCQECNQGSIIEPDCALLLYRLANSTNQKINQTLFETLKAITSTVPNAITKVDQLINGFVQDTFGKI